MLHKSMAAVLALAATAAFGQDPAQTDGDKYKPIFENDCVHMLEYQDRPGEKPNQHKRPAFVLYALSDFQRSIHLPDGKQLKRQFKAGEVMWSDAQTQIGENTGTTPTHVILVEMKSQIGGCAARRPLPFCRTAHCESALGSRVSPQRRSELKSNLRRQLARLRIQGLATDVAAPSAVRRGETGVLSGVGTAGGVTGQRSNRPVLPAERPE